MDNRKEDYKTLEAIKENIERLEDLRGRLEVTYIKSSLYKNDQFIKFQYENEIHSGIIISILIDTKDDEGSFLYNVYNKKSGQFFYDVKEKNIKGFVKNER